MHTKTHTNRLYATDCKCFRSNFARPIGCRPVFGCQIYIKCNFSERFVYFYFGNDSRELFHSEWASTRGINSENQSRIGYQFEVYMGFAAETVPLAGNYHRNTLLGFRNGLERYLKNPPYNNLDPLLML